MLRAFAALCLFVLAGSCTDQGTAAKPCVVTRECEPKQQCVDGKCRERLAVACTTDAECGPGGACLDAACAGGTACSKNADCLSGEACDLVQGMCVLGTCDDKGGCPNGGFCQFARNRCGPRLECTRDDHCGAPNGTCDGGYCAPGCAKTGCAQGLTCLASSGRCGPAESCTSDSACGAPSSICVSGACVPGCGSTGCQGAQSCNTATGRCGGTGTCTTDGECGAPSSICNNGSCIPGCASSGCASGITCNTTTGHCGGGGCSTDNQCQPFEACDTGTHNCVPRTCANSPLECNPPAGRCVSGTCIAGCATTGCTGFCDPSTGVCNQTGGEVPDIPCTSNLDCEGLSCITRPGETNGVCAAMCGKTADCPPGLRCEEAYERPGVKACFGGVHLNSHVGNLGIDAVCKDTSQTRDPNQCQSGICTKGSRDGTEPPTCEPGCSSDNDCVFNTTGGVLELPCRAYWTDPGAYSTQACMGDLFFYLEYDAYYPSVCNTDFGPNNCASLYCSNVSDHCFSACCTSAECGPGSRCMPMLPISIITYTQTVTLMKGCAPQVDGTGTGTLGSACTMETFATCASNRCLTFDAAGTTVDGYCSDTCCRNADCGPGYACVADYDAESGYSWSVCAKVPGN